MPFFGPERTSSKKLIFEVVPRELVVKAAEDWPHSKTWRTVLRPITREASWSAGSPLPLLA